MHLRWRISREHPLAIGAGWFGLLDAQPPPDRRPSHGPRRVQPSRPTTVEVVAEIVRLGAAGTPVIPGSSLKGAVRQVYELLTPSCAWWVGAGCKARPRDQRPPLCPACSLFGAPGFGGRASFGEAEPATSEWADRIAVRRVPAAWEPRQGEEGTVRVYDLQRARTRDGRPAPDAESTWAVWGEFDSKLRLVNASLDELGLLFASLGLSGPSPMVRLSGKKYDGFGAADVDLLQAVQSYPQRQTLAAAAAMTWAEELARQALAGAEERRAAFNMLHGAIGQR
jgi:hypothetical protein